MKLDNRDAYVLLDDITTQENKLKKKDYYKILDVKKDSSLEEIRKQYRKLASKWHPDKNTQSEEQKEHAERVFKDINEAYTVLSDPRKKQIYDVGGNPEDINLQTSDENKNFDDIFKDYFGSSYKFSHKGKIFQ